MYEIIIKGKAYTDYIDLKELDGISCNDNFVEYIDFEWKNKLEYGYLYFEVENDKLFSITKYKANEKLTENELKELGEYTQGQWSDGIGEGFEQQPCWFDDNDEEVYISPWSKDQELTITQEKKI